MPACGSAVAQWQWQSDRLLHHLAGGAVGESCQSMLAWWGSGWVQGFLSWAVDITGSTGCVACHARACAHMWRALHRGGGGLVPGA
jgi:hypothetical protein